MHLTTKHLNNVLTGALDKDILLVGAAGGAGVATVLGVGGVLGATLGVHLPNSEGIKYDVILMYFGCLSPSVSISMFLLT